jgi:hypothetical protein
MLAFVDNLYSCNLPILVGLHCCTGVVGRERDGL